MFLVWFDPDKRRSTQLKLQDALAVYQEKFDEVPAMCLVHEVEKAELLKEASGTSIAIRSERYVARNTFYVGDFDELVELTVPGSGGHNQAA